MSKVTKSYRERLAIVQDCSLYGIVDLGYVAEADAVAMATQLLESGVLVLQLRAKGVDLAVVESLAKELVELVANYSAVFILNDYPQLAVKIGADGVHVGQELQDGSVTDLSEVRASVGSAMIIGHSTHSYEQAIKAKKDGADYIGFGPLFMTQTKPGRSAIGLDEVSSVRRELGLDYPVFCIGGVNSETLAEVMDKGADRVVVVSDLLLAEDVASKVCSFLAELNSLKN